MKKENWRVSLLEEESIYNVEEEEEYGCNRHFNNTEKIDS